MDRFEIINELGKEADYLEEAIQGFKSRKEKVPEQLLRDSITLNQAKIYYTKLEMKRLSH